MAKFRKTLIKLCAVLGAASLFTGFGLESFESAAASLNWDGQKITEGKTALDLKTADFFDTNVVKPLPSTVSPSQELSLILAMDTETVMDAYEKSKNDLTIGEYAVSWEGVRAAEKVEKASNALIKTLNRSGLNYTLGSKYNTVLSGFEITVKASDFEKVAAIVGDEAEIIVGEEYAKAETYEVVTNEVEVYGTGIFDSSNCQYQGDGVVVAVLDTGLDYTHSAFSVENFERTKEAFTPQNLADKVGKTVASQYTSDLKVEDVYLNAKVPFAYDYADRDPDVLPINSEHGTHVAGIIAGKNYDEVTRPEGIIGVAPSAQLAIMKVFSDTRDGAKTTWILDAVEDCVNLGVDVINMSLGTACGFTREEDKDRVNQVYDRVREAGISLIVAAGNDYNSTHGSTKNGSLGLTSNPDSGTVGSPSTYEAALSVASVDGVKTPYLLHGERIIYFKEASTSEAKNKDFVEDILKKAGDGMTTKDFEYVAIPGIGRASDYAEKDYSGKIVLVKRGTSTFEEKVRIAIKEKKAAGIIIYNNVSGDISMSVGDNIEGGVCSLSQEDGEYLAKFGKGILRVSTDQVAGPFMSDFSGWGPTSDLKIKPEITAHGGEIYSAIPGEAYDRLSGTSMAAPNQAGATALIRQYVKDNAAMFGTTATEVVEVTDLVNKLMMSTADIVHNKNGLPFAVRKQGAGLVNITKATTSAGYITTINQKGEEMNRTKFELGDDKARTGVYEMSFIVHNLSNSKVTYAIDSIVQTEGVGTTYTGHDETTVTQEGYLLEGTQTTVTKVDGGVQNGNNVSINAESEAKVTVKIVLSDEDKAYLESSFENGMYVEGFITLTATEGTSVNMSAPLLAFYGDWTEAPIFDEEYYDTHKDEINKGLDHHEKVMEDAYATRVIGGLYSDYISTLGSYHFKQDPSMTQIAASKDKISISNQEQGQNSTITSIYGIWAGLLRNVKTAEITVTEDATGKVIYEQTEKNIRKSYGIGTIYNSSIDMEFAALANNLKNNTRYTVTVETYIDYEGEQKNDRNVFSFPLYIDIQAPVVTDVKFRSEYDKSSKKTRLYADMSVYDNHYAMGLQIGQIIPSKEAGYLFSMDTFGKYMKPVYSTFNSTSTVTFELTDYISKIKNSVAMGFDNEGNVVAKEGVNTFIVACYDYALNSATYEIKIPDEILEVAFTQDEITLRPNETKDLTQLVSVYPETSWAQVLDFEVVKENGEDLDGNEPTVVEIINQNILPKKEGSAVIKAYGYDAEGNEACAYLTVNVSGGSGLHADISKFEVTGYKTVHAFYSTSNDDREIGTTGSTNYFGNSKALSMYPSEQVTLIYDLESYFPDDTTVEFVSGNTNIATVDENGTITAKGTKKGTTSINIIVKVKVNGKTTTRNASVSVSVKDPFITNVIYLTSYKGEGGTVTIPGDRGITTINPYAFSNYTFVDKDVNAGDEISDEDPLKIKQQYLGENKGVKKVIIPEGVTTISHYAFAGMTGLEEVVFPSTLTTIGVGAFYNCRNLTKITTDGLDVTYEGNFLNAKFINEKAFANTGLEEMLFLSAVAIGNYTFENCKFESLVLPETAQSLGVGAFRNNKDLREVRFDAPKMKLGDRVFEYCTSLRNISVNAAVIPNRAFYGCSRLETVTLGKDVTVIGEYAFDKSALKKFETVDGSPLDIQANGTLVLRNGEVLIAAPTFAGTNNTGKYTFDESVTSIAPGAFVGNTKLSEITALGVKTVGASAFAKCTNLRKVNITAVESIGAYAFSETGLIETPSLASASFIGNHAFSYTDVRTVAVKSGTAENRVKVGDYAFAYCDKLETVTLGDYVTVGSYAFYYEPELLLVEDNDTIGNFKYYTGYAYEVFDDAGNKVNEYTYYRYNLTSGTNSLLTGVTVGANTELGDYAFAGNGNLKNLTLAEGTRVGDHAFYDNFSLVNVDLSKVAHIGSYAFSGKQIPEFTMDGNTLTPALEIRVVDGEEIPVNYKYSHMSSSIAEANLTNVVSFGEFAFAGNVSLTKVILGDGVEEIAPYAFAQTSFKEITLGGKVKKIGEAAFYNSKIENIDLSKVEEIGKFAFLQTGLTEVTLFNGAKVGEGAFAYCQQLAKVEGIETLTEIGASAFQATAITKADLTSATKVGDYAFQDSAVTEVTLGENLVSFGENPFYGCKIATFGKMEEKKVGTELNETYDVNDKIRIIGGVLYQVTPNGKLELVAYPIAKTDAAYVVEEGTSRISAGAFAGAPLTNVTIATTVKAIGAKAFYGCENLATVIFTSYEAPLLEEEYDMSRLTFENLPMTGQMSDGMGNLFEGLGITKYFMWNITSNFNNFYFGATFVDYIGHLETKLVMVKPSNGSGYNTFIFDQYFGTVAQGAVAAMQSTLDVMAKIAALPEVKDITLANEGLIASVRAAFEAIPSYEQKALVSNYDVLTAAEAKIAYLKTKEEKPPVTDDPIDGPKENGGAAWIGWVVAVVAVLACAGYIVWDKVLLPKRKVAFAVAEEEEPSTEESNNETEE